MNTLTEWLTTSILVEFLSNFKICDGEGSINTEHINGIMKLLKIGGSFKEYQDKKMTVEYSKCWVMVIVSFISVAVTTACFESLQVFTGDSP